MFNTPLETSRSASRHAGTIALFVAAVGLSLLTRSALAQPASAPSANPASGTAAALAAEGRTIAQRDCVECHVVVPSSKPGWTDAPAFDVIANRRGETAARISAAVQKGHIDMLNDQRPKPEADAIAAYIISLRKR